MEPSPQVPGVHALGPGPCSTPFGIIGTLTDIYLTWSANGTGCSTPFGIIGTLTRWWGCLSSVVGFKCSTPFGIIGTLTRRQHVPDEAQRPVLNAFRHHWNPHRLGMGQSAIISKCSTPFGIIGTLTSTRTAQASSTPGAQRLSASLEPSPWVCSPATALKGSAQRLSASLEPSPVMRNLPERRRNSAQRLSASLEPSLFASLSETSSEKSAQRLSASLEPSRRTASRQLPDHIVLNAFRHHWNPHCAHQC